MTKLIASIASALLVIVLVIALVAVNPQQPEDSSECGNDGSKSTTVLCKLIETIPLILPFLLIQEDGGSSDDSETKPSRENEGDWTDSLG
jgi:hypothetical protein